LAASAGARPGPFASSSAVSPSATLRVNEEAQIPSHVATAPERPGRMLRANAPGRFLVRAPARDQPTHSAVDA
jgi:hypothetical protein